MSPFTQSISVWQGIALYVGAVVGSGILILPGITAGIAGPNALLSWVGMACLGMPLASTFAFLARKYPSAGGVATFVEKAFGRYAGAIIGWFYFIAAAVGQIIVPLTGGMYLTYALQLPSEMAFVTAGVIVLAAVTANYLGIKTSGKVQLIICGLTLLVLLGTIVLALPLIEAENLTINLTSDEAIASVGTAGMLIFWSFFGWEAITSLAPEFQNPKRDIVRATIGAVIIVGIVYVGSAVAVIGTHSYSIGTDTINQSMNHASLVQLITLTTGVNGGYATAIVALIICLGTTNAFVAGISRLGYSLAEEKMAPSWLYWMNEKYSTPSRVIFFVGVVAIGGLTMTYAWEIGLEQLVYIPNSLGIATYILGALAGVKLLPSNMEKGMAGFTCLVCSLAYPFVGVFIQIPIVVAVGCFLYVYGRQMREQP
ncbi:amino acid permease [Brevibacillus humidisoli]|uniref:APC family permease n=1 Tax=Brevibacillus humidisoli TaxID=2895522 RepID=UPI001E5D1F09|nr:amino acid permease [Brevibacillus humidisoli]UFJ40332.1 amino acid permease [Brevibacillus humidisoli]